jgi:hypothetical protein
LSDDYLKMKTLTTYEFLRHFLRHSKDSVAVKKRGKVVGTWIPAPMEMQPVDILARQKADGFTKRLPFTFAELLKKVRSDNLRRPKLPLLSGWRRCQYPCGSRHLFRRCQTSTGIHALAAF